MHCGNYIIRSSLKLQIYTPIIFHCPQSKSRRKNCFLLNKSYIQKTVYVCVWEKHGMMNSIADVQENQQRQDIKQTLFPRGDRYSPLKTLWVLSTEMTLLWFWFSGMRHIKLVIFSSLMSITWNSLGHWSLHGYIYNTAI